MVELNRLAWMVLFLLGTALFAWWEWQDNNGSQMAWFMLTSLWSAGCGIGYTVIHWFVSDRTPGRSRRQTRE